MSSSVVNPDYCVDPDDLIAFDGPPVVCGPPSPSGALSSHSTCSTLATVYREDENRYENSSSLVRDSRCAVQPVRRASRIRASHTCAAARTCAGEQRACACCGGDGGGEEAHKKAAEQVLERAREQAASARGFSTARWRWW